MPKYFKILIKISNIKKKKMTKSRIQKLENLIKKNTKKYYNSPNDDDLLDDKEFDKLYDELEVLDPKNKLLRDIGKDHSNNFQVEKHIMPMGS